MVGAEKVADDYAGAAMRHFKDAEHLAAAQRYDNAGHLIGFAGECAMKKKLRDLYGKPNQQITGHHPEPQTLMRIHMRSRNMNGQWLALCAGPRMFKGWYVNQRYLSDDHIDKATYESWKNLASRLIAMANIKQKVGAK